MRLHGTKRGQELYPDDPYWTAKDAVTFRRRFFWNHWRIKSCFGAQQQAKKRDHEAIEGTHVFACVHVCGVCVCLCVRVLGLGFDINVHSHQKHTHTIT